jgi:hypothetical protein
VLGTGRVSGERASGGTATTTALCRAALLGMVVVLIVIAYFPFAWSPPRMVRNQVTRGEDGSLQFSRMNYARTSATPPWLQDVRTSGAIRIQLQAAPRSLHQNALIMVLASDDWHTDVAIGQFNSTLQVWLRRPGTDTDGVPGFAVDEVFLPQRWTSVEVVLQHGDLRIDVGGRSRLTGHLPADSPRMWSPGQLALGDKIHGGDPWQGQIRRAQVRTPGYAIDYVRRGALSIPPSYLYLPDHIEPFPPTTGKQWLLAIFDMLSFIPLGFLIVLSRRPPVRPVPATVFAAALALVLAAGKFLFHGRHTSAANIVMEAVGGLLGALLAWQLAHARHKTTWLRPIDRSTRRGCLPPQGIIGQSVRPAVSGRHPRSQANPPMPSSGPCVPAQAPLRPPHQVAR